MVNRWSRRGILQVGAAAGLGAFGSRTAIGAPAFHTRRAQSTRPLVISSGNGAEACKKAMEMLQAGEDTLDAVIAGVNIVEQDPNDMSVGYGGLPNEDGVVQLDSSVMHGPTRNGGAVAAIEGIKTPSKVAKLVMEANHDLEMLRNGPYPWFVKQRVMSRDGHLSNHALSDFLSNDFDGTAQVLVLAHLSECNNHPEIARMAATSALERQNGRETRLAVSSQQQPTEMFRF